MLAITIVSVIPSTSYALDWTPKLIQAKSPEFRDPQDVIQIDLPEDLTEKIFKTLAFELDNIDITAMITQSGRTSLYIPVQPLQWGKHTLRLVEYEDDGSIIERGFWEFEVRDSSVFQAIDYSVDSNLTVSQRIADKNLGMPEPGSLSGQGAAVLNGLLSNEDWQINGNVDLIYNSETERTRNGQQLDVGEFLITGRNDSAQLNLGHHSIAQTNLVVDNFYRRGLSANMRIDSVSSTATGFVMRTEAVTGTQEGFGISDPDNTVTGVSWESQPLSENPENLYLSATYLSGKRNSVPESVGAFQTLQKGDSWGLVADSSLYDQQLRLRVEYAESINDVITDDVNDIDVTDAEGTAKSFLLTYSPLMKEVGSTFFWNTGLEYSEVSTLFNSLANPNLPSDKTLHRLFLNTNWSSVSAQFLTALETDNVDEDDARSQIETRLYQAALNYNPVVNPSPGSVFDYLGRPNFSLQFSKTAQDQIKESLIPTTDLKINTTTSAFSAGFIKNRWSWNWLSSWSEQDDKIESINNSTTWLHNLTANINANNRLVIKPNILSQKTNFTVFGGDLNSLLLGLDMDYLFTESLTGELNLNQSNSESDISTSMQDVELTTLGYGVVWNWISAKNNKPGFDVVFRGIYQNRKDKFVVSNNLETYEVTIGLTMILPSSSVR